MTTYAEFLDAFKVTEEEVQRRMETLRVCILYPSRLKIAPSTIAGVGLFTKVLIEEGDHIGRVGAGMTAYECGRFINHSATPNVVFSFGCCYATEDIPKGIEITVDYSKALKSFM